VPLLALVFGGDIRYAIGASLVSVIATSCGAAALFNIGGCHTAAATEDTPDFLANYLHLDGTYPSSHGLVSYHVHAIPAGFSRVHTLVGPEEVKSHLFYHTKSSAIPRAGTFPEL
jgi:hypothetical protein